MKRGHFLLFLFVAAFGANLAILLVFGENDHRAGGYLGTAVEAAGGAIFIWALSALPTWMATAGSVRYWSSALILVVLIWLTALGRWPG